MTPMIVQETAPSNAAESPAAGEQTPVSEVQSAQVGLQSAQTESFRATEYDLPETSVGLLLLIGGLFVLFGLAVRTSLRDSRFLKRAWRISLLLPRLFVFVLLVIVMLNPRQRTQLTRIEKSRVGILIDTSLSMSYPATDGSDQTDQTDPGSRGAAVLEALIDQGLLTQLSETHEISIFGFDSSLRGPLAVISGGEVRFRDEQLGVAAKSETAAGETNATVLDLNRPSEEDRNELTDPETKERLRQLIRTEGSETRLGETLHQLLGQIAGRTLSGLVVLTDGQSNAGLGIEAARQRAERTSTRLIVAGTGSQIPQKNVWVAGLQSPTDVHKGDPFEISAVIQGQGVEEQAVVVQVFQEGLDGRAENNRPIAEQIVTFGKELLPITVRFDLQQPVPGKYTYMVRAALQDATSTEITRDDNERHREIEITDRRIRVMVMSSGPMRDYQFVRNTLYRHSGIDSDVWLQSVTDENIGMVSQESKKLLKEFPATEAELFEYDVIVAFDPDWSRLSADQQRYLNRWVAEHSGGLIVVDGEIYTPKTAQEPDNFREIMVMYPVVLNRMLPELELTQRADEPWPLVLTPVGRSSEFLKIADESGNLNMELWSTFRGIFRSYPVKSLRDGASVLLEYGNPRARTELGQPPFLAIQYYGTGRTMFLGSAETWRLREISPQGYQRFWTSLIREAGQGRRSRGSARGLLLLDRTEAVPGQAINIRAQLYDSRLQPLKADSAVMTIVDSAGREMAVPDRLNADGRGAGQFVANFRPSRPGLYRITVPVPESSDVLQAAVEVLLPNLESQDPVQNVALLKDLTADIDGTYMQLAEITKKLPGLLPDRSIPVVVDEQSPTMWDRSWLMYLMIGLLCLEWALRRIVRLS